MWEVIRYIILVILGTTIAWVLLAFLVWVLSHIQARAWLNVFEEYLNKKHSKFKNNEEDERKE